MIQNVFPNKRPVYQDDNVPIHTAGIMRDWYNEHDDQLQHLVWSPQFPDLNIIETLWGILETRLRLQRHFWS